MISYSLSLPPRAPTNGDLHAILIALRDWEANPISTMTCRVVIPYSQHGGVWGVRVYDDAMILVWGRHKLDLPDLVVDITLCATEAEILAAYRGTLAFVGAHVRDAARTMLDAVTAAEQQP